MIARRMCALAMLAAVVLTTGCAVGRLITGEPVQRSFAAHHALLERRCAGCHVVPEPEAMSAVAWQASLERMKRRMQLPQAEWDSLAVMPTQPPRGER